MPAMESGCSFAREGALLESAEEKRPEEREGEQMTWLNERGGEGLLCKWMKSLTSYTLRSLSAIPVPRRRKRTGEEIRTSSQFN